MADAALDGAHPERIRPPLGEGPAYGAGLHGIAGSRARAVGLHVGKALDAEACGVDRQSYNRWENGTYWPSAKMLPILAAALGCTIEDLFLPDEESEGY